MSSVVQITTMTWPRDSHFLYDYTDSSVAMQKLTLTHGAQLVLRDRKKCFLFREDQELDRSVEVSLGWILEDADGFYFASAYRDQPRWKVVRWGKQEGYELTAGQLLKLGRILLKVHQVHTDLGSSCHWDDSECEAAPSPPGLEVPSCRVCLGEESTESDPLLSPCHCSGSIRFIHSRCLSELLRSRQEKKVRGAVTSYLWTKFACELCKQRFPRRLTNGGKMIEVLRFVLPEEGAYIILEGAAKGCNLQLHVMSLTENRDVGIGRDVENDLSLLDIGVSRLHAKIRLCKGRCLLLDLHSKFGTLVLAKNSERLTLGENVAFQVNNTVIKMKMKRQQQCCPLWPFRVAAEERYIKKDDNLSLSSASMYRNQHLFSLGYSAIDHSSQSLNHLST